MKSTIDKQQIKDTILVDFLTKWDPKKQIGGYISHKIALPDGLFLIYTIMCHITDIVTPYFESFYVEAEIENIREYERFDLSKEMNETINCIINPPLLPFSKFQLN